MLAVGIAEFTPLLTFSIIALQHVKTAVYAYSTGTAHGLTLAYLNFEYSNRAATLIIL